MDKEELLGLAFIKLAKAVKMLQMAGEEALAEEAEALAGKVDRAATAESAHPSLVEVKTRRTQKRRAPSFPLALFL